MDDITLNMIMCLLKAFPKAIIDQYGNFIPYPGTGECFKLTDCHCVLDIQCKVLEYLSRAAYKTQWYDSDRKNAEAHKAFAGGINRYLGTCFSADDYDQIYTYLGNCCHHEKTVAFIRSGYNMDVLTRKRITQ